MKKIFTTILSWTCLAGMAVSQAIGATGDYVKVKTAPDDWSGEYLIVYEESTTSGLAFKGSLTSIDAVGNNVAVTISHDTIYALSNPNIDNERVVIALTDAANARYSVRTASGLYIGNSGTSNALSGNATTVYPNTLQLNEDCSVVMTSCASSTPTYMRYNNASNQNRFRYYKSASSQQKVSLYRRLSDNEQTITSVALTGTPTQTTYYQYDAFSTQGLRVVATYSDNSTVDMTDYATWECAPDVFTTLGEQTVMVSASVGGKEDIQEYNVTVVASPYQKARLGTFAATSGNINADVAYAAYQGNGTTRPAVNGDGNLMLYQGSTGVGGYISLVGDRGVTIKEVKLYTAYNYDVTKVACVEGTLNDENYPEAGQGTTVARSSLYYKQNLNNDTVTFYCLGADKGERLCIDSIIVHYLKEEVTLTRLRIDTARVRRTYDQNRPFNPAGLIAWAYYSNGDSVLVSDLVTLTAPDMSQPGVQTITVQYVEDGITLSQTFQILVNEVDYLFYESFDECAATGGNDGRWSGSIGSGTVTLDNEWVNKTNVGGADSCLKVGTGSNKGSIQSPAITTAGSAARLTFRAGGWDGDNCQQIVISTTSGLIGRDAFTATGTSVEVTLTAGEWNDYAVILVGIEAPVQFTISAKQASSNRFFLDEVKLYDYVVQEPSGLAIWGSTPDSTYQIGQTLDRTGLTAWAKFSDTDSLEVTDLCDWSIEPATFASAGEDITVTVTAQYSGLSAQCEECVTVSRSASAITIEDMALSVGLSQTIEAETTPADAALTYSVVSGADVISLSGNTITGLQNGTAVVRASYAGSDGYAPAETTFTVTVDAYMTAVITEFTSAEGDFGTNAAIHYCGYKGTGTTAAKANDRGLTLYQGGGYVTVSGAVGVTLHEVTITTGTEYASTSVGVAIDDAAVPATGTTVTKGSTYTVSDLECDSVRFYCIGGNKSTRLQIASITVKYSRVDVSLSSITLNTDETVTEFVQRSEFSHEGTIVTAHYSDGSEADVTADAAFSTPDMTVTGEQTITVTYGGKSATYTVTITPEVLESLSLSGNYPTRFNAGDTFSHAGLVVTAHYNSGRTADVTAEVTFSEVEMTAGDHVVTVSYGGVQQQYSIRIKDANTLFYESFDLCAGTGGNDDRWNGSIGSATVTTDSTDWSMVKAGGADGCLKLGNSNNGGSAQTPAITIGEDVAVLTFRAGAWLADEEKDSIVLSATSGTLSTTRLELTRGAWRNYAVALTGAGASTQITFSAKEASQNRFFLDDVRVSRGYSRAVTLADDGYRWGTICLPCDVTAAGRSGAAFYSVVEVLRNSDSEVIGLSLGEETGTLLAGRPYICCAYAPTVVCAYSGTAVSEAIQAPYLVGNLSAEPLTVADGHFLIGENQIHMVNGAEAWIGCNRAYIDVRPLGIGEVPVEVYANVVRLYFDGTVEGDIVTALESIESCDSQAPATFDLQGRQVSAPQRGQLYLRGGQLYMLR